MTFVSISNILYPYMSKPSIDRVVNVPDEMIRKLLTDSEIRMVKQRLLIINLLDEGLSIRQVAEKAKVGTDTVVRVARMAQKHSLRKNPHSRRTMKKVPGKTAWIFGRSE